MVQRGMEIDTMIGVNFDMSIRYHPLLKFLFTICSRFSIVIRNLPDKI